MGNEKISLTAEAVAFIRQKTQKDRFSKYFVTPRSTTIIKIAAALVSENILSHLFSKRMDISEDLHSAIEKFRPEQIVELGAGYSTFGLEYVLAHPGCIYIETDFPKVVSLKKSIVNKIIRVEKLRELDALVFVPMDLVREDLYDSLKNKIKRGRKTLVFSEGLNTYLDQKNYDSLVANVIKFLKHSKEGSVYLSHEPTAKQREKMFPSAGIKILRGAMSILIHNRFHTHFKTENELKNYFIKLGFAHVDIIKRRPYSTTYLAGL